MLRVLQLLCLAGLLHAGEIDNRLTGEPVVNCQDTMVSLTFETEKPFNGRIYVKGLADDSRCSRSFATNEDQSRFSMQISNGDCNMQRQRMSEGPLEGLVFSMVIIFSFHGTFVTKSDRAFRCMCFFRNIKRVTNFMDMSMIGTTELLDTAKTPTCLYSIRSGGPDGPFIRYAKIGDEIYHTWECDDPEQGFLVHSCWVNDGRGNRFDLLDIDGCAIDPVIQPDVQYTDDLRMAYVETHGYKFSDTSVLDYMCVIELCKIAQGECIGLTPPSCGRGKRSVETAGKKMVPKEVHNDANSELRESPRGFDLSATLKVIDTLDENGSPDATFRSSRLLLDTLNQGGGLLISGPADQIPMCLSTPTFGVMVALNAVLLATLVAMAGMAYVRSATNATTAQSKKI